MPPPPRQVGLNASEYIVCASEQFFDPCFMLNPDFNPN